MLFNERLRQLRKKNKLTAKEFSAILNISHSSVSLYESGKRTPCIELIIKMAKYFDVSTDYLFGITEIPYSVEHFTNKDIKFDIPPNIDIIFNHINIKEHIKYSTLKIDDEFSNIFKQSMLKFIETFYYMTHGKS